MARLRRSTWAAVSYLLLGVLALFSVGPLAWVLSTSIKPLTEVFSIPPRWFPRNPTLGNFRLVLFQSAMPRYFVNSLLTGLLTTAVSLLLGCSAGYGFARFNFPGSRSLSLFMLLGQLFPLTVFLVPVYVLMIRTHLLDTIVGVACAHLILTMPLVTWMARSYFMTIPRELEEAAQIDGCSHLEALRRVVVPLSAPGIAAVAIFAFLMSWNEFVLASVLTSSDRSRTLPIGLTEFAVMFRVDWGSTMAAAALMSAPVIVFFLLLQRYFVQGLSQGAVKG